MPAAIAINGATVHGTPFSIARAVTTLARPATDGKLTSISPLATIHVNPSTITAMTLEDLTALTRFDALRNDGASMQKNTTIARNTHTSIYCGRNNDVTRRFTTHLHRRQVRLESVACG